jgi:hypothetical protein
MSTTPQERSLAARDQWLQQRATATTLPCPTCQARASHPCDDGRGPMPGLHAQRVRATREHP